MSESQHYPARRLPPGAVAPGGNVQQVLDVRIVDIPAAFVFAEKDGRRLLLLRAGTGMDEALAIIEEHRAGQLVRFVA